jgi:phosphotransferase system  glucose/maltose/N-acetylglucosamine-specific IIC component
MMAIVTTFGFSTGPNAVGKAIGVIGESRTLGYAEYGAAGMLTLFVRGMLCNWMVSTGVEHSIVNMFLFPSGPRCAAWRSGAPTPAPRCAAPARRR